MGLTVDLTQGKLESLYKTKNCEISGLPLIFKANSGLNGVSVYRKDKNLGLTDSNTRLVTTGMNQLRSDSSYEMFMEYLSLTDTQPEKDIKLSLNTNMKLNDIFSSAKARAKNKANLLGKPLDEFFNITFDELLAKFLETKGLCSITNVPLDLEFRTPRAIRNPSLVRIDSNLGYIKGNIQFISLGANFMKHEVNSNEDSKKFYREALDGVRRLSATINPAK